MLAALSVFIPFPTLGALRRRSIGLRWAGGDAACIFRVPVPFVGGAILVGPTGDLRRM